ncbi:tRNA (32-2'-O)-methyltransferase regulator THADA-like isoform X2 [Lineus longissimus]|uniref:tRNA (32-2'-O)-methyltransferase regulator THADA-like isoform X2 n=1 Tax=Lineus longissimus TaxID=88925 RepID=UPI00315DBFC8
MPKTSKTRDRHVLEDLDKICTVLDGSTQLIAVKRVGSYLTAAPRCSDVTHLCIEVVVDLYFKCPTSFPLKKLITSSLNGASPVLQTEIQSILTEKLKDVSSLEDGQPVVKLDVENLLMLLDTLSQIEKCLEPIIVEVLGFLARAVSQSSQRSRETNSPVEKNQAMQLCLKSIQTINRILQKFSIKLTDLFAAGELSDHFGKIIKCIQEILVSDYFLLDCQSTSGMTLPLLFNVMYDQSAISMIYHFILGEDIQTLVNASFTPEGASYPSLCTSSQICLLHGLSTALGTGDLTKEPAGRPGTNLLITVINKILLISERSVDTNTNFIRSRCLIAWTAKACQCLDEQPDNVCLKDHLRGQQDIAQKILSYVWTHWEDPVEPVRHQARIVFVNTVQIHLKATGEDPKDSKFVEELGVSLLGIPWTSKGKFGPLCSLVDHLGAEKFLQISPTLPYQILNVITDHSYGNQAGELYDKLASVSKEELGLKGKTSPEKDLVNWQQKWVDPVLQVLCQGTKTQKGIVMEYMLPKLLKGTPASLKYITKKMSSDPSGLSSNKLCALMSCLKKARSLGHIHQRDDVKEENSMWNEAVPMEVLRTALVHNDDQIRLDSLGLIVENPKITEIISGQDFELVKSFLPWNLSSQYPAFRQQLVSLLKRFFFRLRESGAVLLRNLSNGAKRKPDIGRKKMETAIQYNKDFLKWLCDLLFNSLYPGVCFPRMSTVLSIFSTLLTILEDEKGPQPELFHLPDHVNPCRARSLIECLTATFEDNKKHALNILLHLPSEAIGFDNKDTIKEYYDVCTELICTTKPQDCGTAAYLLQLLIHQDQFFSLLAKDKQCIENSLESRRLLCLNELLTIYQEQLDTAKISLLHASATRPMYPVLHCIRYILATIDLKSVILVAEWREYLEQLIQACFDLTTVVSPVISHSSPEGNVPIETFLESDHEASKDIEESVKLVQDMPQYLIVCCWRSIKEISLLLGQLTLTAPIHHDGDEKGMLSCKLLCSIGDYFIDLLLESRHRGAFELAYAGFVGMCQMLWSCPISSLHVLPKQWLKQIMIDVKDSDAESSRLCATRRSAGVPFYVQALVSTEPTSTGRLCFKETMKIMMELALSEDTEKENIPKVHALNILRTLFRDTRLSDDVFPFIADGLKAAVLGFLSQDWAIRNSATLLFSALMTRIFGVPRGKDAQNKKNCLSGRVFFHRFPTVFPFLLEQLEVATTNIGGNGQFRLHPGLYPALMILGRLLPSILEGKDTNLNLGDFVPYVVKCASSPVFKTRLMASRALQPLVFEEQLVTVIMDLVQQLPIEGKKTSHNLIHGILLQIDGLLQNVDQGSCKLMKRLSATLPCFAKTVWIATSANQDYVTRAAYLAMLQVLLFLDWPQDSVEGKVSLDEICDTIFEMQSELDGATGNHQFPCYVDFLCALGKMLLRLSRRNQVKDTIDLDNLYHSLISNSSYEVRLLGLQEMKTSVTGTDDDGDFASCDPCDFPGEEGDFRCQQTGAIGGKEPGMRSSTVILEKLICMALKEERHPECLTLVLEVLSVHPGIDKHTWKVDEKMYTASEVLQWLIELAISHPMDEVRCAALTLSKAVVPLVYDSLQLEDSPKDDLDILRRWITLLLEASSDHQSLDSRVACIRVIFSSYTAILIDRKCVLDDIPFTAWTVVIKLLQDDDVTVREMAADVVSRVLKAVGKESSYQSLQQTFALDIAIKMMVLLFSWRNWTECFQTLVSWTTGDWEKTIAGEQDQEGRLFDKGELNTYEDDVTFNRMAVSHMHTFLEIPETSADENQQIGKNPMLQDTRKSQLSGSPQTSPGKVPEDFKSSNQSTVWDIVAKAIPTVVGVGSNRKLPFSMFPAVSNDHMTVYDTYGGLSLLLDDKLSLLTTVQNHAQVIVDFPSYSQWVTDTYRILTTLFVLRGSLEKSGNIVADSTWDFYDQTLSKMKDIVDKLHSGLLKEALS